MVGFANDSVQMYSSFEQIQTALSGMVGSAEKGKEMFEDLRKFSFETTFGVDTLSAAATQLLQTGTAVDDVKKRLKQLGDVAGGNTNKFNELVTIFAKIQNTGKATSMQLQQLALRGVPIYQMLQQMGVEGTATADDITKAFEQMTDAGGMFYNNMQAINDTISGREGFIADTYKEFLASFAEASGLAEVYKAALDVVYDALQWIVDALQKINENPITQALFRGALAAGITALAVVLGGTLISSLTAVITKLGIIAALKTAINPLGMVAGLAAVAVGAIAVGASFASMREEEEKAHIAHADFIDDISDITTELSDAQDIINDIDAGNMVFNQESMDSVRLELHDLANDIDDIFSRNGAEGFDWVTNGLDTSKLWRDSAEDVQELYDRYNEYLGLYRQQKNWVVETNFFLQEQNRILQSNADVQAKVAEMSSRIQTDYAKTDKGKYEALMQQIEYYRDIEKNGVLGTEKRRVGSYQEATRDFTYRTKDTAEYTQAVEVLRSLEKEMEGMLSKNRKKGWEEIMAEVTGVSKAQAEKVLGNEGHTLGENFVYAWAESIDKANEYTKNMNSPFTTLEENLDTDIENIKKKYQDMFQLQKELEARNDEIRSGEKFTSENTYLIEVNNQLKEIEEEYQKALEAKKEFEAGKYYEETVRNLSKEMDLMGLTNAELAKQEALLKGCNLEQAENIKHMVEENEHAQRLLDKQNALNEAKKQGNYFAELGNQLLENAINQYAETGKLDKSEYAGGMFLNKASGMAQGTDVGNAIQGFQQGGPWGAIINVVMGALFNVAKGMEGFQEFLNPVTKWFQNLAPLIKIIIDVTNEVNAILNEFFKILGVVAQALGPIIKILTSLGKPIAAILAIIGKLLSKLTPYLEIFANIIDRVCNILFGWCDALVESKEEQEDETERLKALNEQYENLMSALREQEQYYLEQRRKLNADYINALIEAGIATNVHDMIITPQGRFSTDPDDYIIATKNPSALGGGNQSVAVVSMNVQIKNEMGDSASVNVARRENGDGSQDLFVTISRKVANDVAQGVNGWDNALNARASRLQGRSIQ